MLRAISILLPVNPGTQLPLVDEVNEIRTKPRARFRLGITESNFYSKLSLLFSDAHIPSTVPRSQYATSDYRSKVGNMELLIKKLKSYYEVHFGFVDVSTVSVSHCNLATNRTFLANVS